ncbi:MAG: SRPBCC family protein [Acidobacteriota bacterium]
MQIDRDVLIDASPDAVWEILADRYHEVDAWASSVAQSSARDLRSTIPGAPNGRVCETSLGPVEESIVAFDANHRLLAYTAHAPKMPFFVRGLRNQWQVLSAGARRSKVEMRLQADLAFPFNLLMAPMMRRQMGTILTHAVEELKHFAEHGQPHPRKAEADREAAQAA